MNYLFTSESVSKGHPDKICDQISDAILDAYLLHDENSHVAIEVMVTTGLVVISGEVKSTVNVDYAQIARNVIKSIGYNSSELKFDAESCGIIVTVHHQSQDIDMGVSKSTQGAGDQGMMFGYATNETDEYMPLPIMLSHKILQKLDEYKQTLPILRPDSKSQVTVEYNEQNKPVRIDTIIVSTQHSEFADTDEEMQYSLSSIIRKVINDVKTELPDSIQKLFSDYKLFVNPTGRFVIGGPHGDTGLTGRKIIVDTYGGRGAHGGGAFSGKDPSKVDRSAAYAARYMAKNIVAAGLCDECLVEVAYAIGIAEPVSLYINTLGTSKLSCDDGTLSNLVADIFNMTPEGITCELSLKSPIYHETSAYGHFGRKCETINKDLNIFGEDNNKAVKIFPWEELNKVEQIKQKLGKYIK